jgi:hypothetical protein
MQRGLPGNSRKALHLGSIDLACKLLLPPPCGYPPQSQTDDCTTSNLLRSFFVRRPVLLPFSLSALVSFLPCNRLEPPDIDDNDGVWTYALVWLALEHVQTCAFALRAVDSKCTLRLAFPPSTSFPSSGALRVSTPCSPFSSAPSFPPSASHNIHMYAVSQ